MWPQKCKNLCKSQKKNSLHHKTIIYSIHSWNLTQNNKNLISGFFPESGSGFLSGFYIFRIFRFFWIRRINEQYLSKNFKITVPCSEFEYFENANLLRRLDFKLCQINCYSICDVYSFFLLNRRLLLHVMISEWTNWFRVC